jgi:hypothetical protein
VGEEFFRLFNGIFYLIGFPVDSVNYNYECWFYAKYGPKDGMYAYYSSLVALGEPLLKIFLVFFVWIIKRIFKIQAFKNRYFIISITSVILIEQLGVIKILMSSFKCIQLENGESYMERNPNVKCNSDEYEFFRLYFYTPLIILWAGGFTLLLFFYICRNKVNKSYAFVNVLSLV